MTFALREQFTLEPWQREAVSAWLASEDPRLGRRHGILDIYTGAGKTVVALGAMAAVRAEAPTTKVAVVVPTIALAQQWVVAVAERTTLPRARVGMVGGAESDTFATKDVVVYVLASARATVGAGSRLAADVAGHAVMLVVDECHKAGAASSSRIFDAVTTCRLGLSATPQREGADAQDDLGGVLPLERQRHGRALGGVCYRLSLRDGYERGMLPRYEIHHHGIALTQREEGEFGPIKHRVSQARQAVSRAGGSPDRYLSYLTGRARNVSAALKSAAAGLQSAYLERKHFLYQASERMRVVERILVQSWHDERLGAPQGAVLFNERIGDSGEATPSAEDDADDDVDDDADVALSTGAENLCLRVKALADDGALPFGSDAVAVEHSRKTPVERKAALDGLRTGAVQVLVSVKALQEGIDIPDVGLGVSVASTASARQRIQTMGRILRPARDASGQRIDPEQAPVKRLHLLYVRGTVDEEIYKRTDWNDQTGADRNHWWTWGLDDDEPTLSDELIPTDVDEQTAWDRLDGKTLPQPWDGPTNVLPLVHKQGSVFVVTGKQPLPVSNAPAIIDLLNAGKKRGFYKDARGGFRVTPALNVVLKRGPTPGDPKTQVWFAVGRLAQEPTWPGQGEEPASADAVEEPETASAPASASRPKRRRSADPWFVQVQIGFQAAAAGDAETLSEVCDQLRGPKRTWAHAAMQALVDGETLPPGASETPPTSLELLLPFVARAHASGRKDLLHQAAKAFRIGKANKPKRVAIANALAILTGASETIWRADD